MKLLMIRFSSFGDIVHAIAVPRAFLDIYPESTVDWLTREEFAGLLEQQSSITRVLPFSRRLGLKGLIKTAVQLSGAGYTHVYDAHSNLRSSILVGILRVLNMFARLRSLPFSQFAKRPKNRIRRFLFFKFRMNVLPRPFRAADSYHRPLVKWGLLPHVPLGRQFFLNEEARPDASISIELTLELERLRDSFSSLIAMAPSAAWEMKRWPTEHWKSLIASLPGAGFVLLGGKEDTFLEEIRLSAPGQVVNSAGRLSMVESARVIAGADLVISNDTGSLQVADQMERPTIALIGPTAFGYPSHPTSITMERPLSCQPCSKDGRGGCVNSLYKRCLVELTPESVREQVLILLAARGPTNKGSRR
jgi:ADP-heptose:LPS heptosyltransferase